VYESFISLSLDCFQAKRTRYFVVRFEVWIMHVYDIIIAYFWRNPQFGVTVGSGRRAQGGGEERCHMVVSLMQESQDLKFTLDISLFLYRVNLLTIFFT